VSGTKAIEKGHVVPYVSVEHEPGLWVDAHVERQWKEEGQWRLSVRYIVDTLAYCRVLDADQVRQVIAAELQGHERRRATAGHEPPHGRHDRRVSIDLRQARPVDPLD
jgi:hypothetical protein